MTCIEVTGPIKDIILDESVSQVHIDLELLGNRLGTIAVPIQGQVVARDAILDAIVCQSTYAWDILMAFFEKTLYPRFRLEGTPTNFSLWRGKLCLVDALQDQNGTIWQQAKDKAGWTLFLQELWGLEHVTSKQFYEARDTEETTITVPHNDDTPYVFDVSDVVPNIATDREELQVAFSVGGVILGETTVSVAKSLIPAPKLRSDLTLLGGQRLYKLAVREGLIGQPFENVSLRDRLAIRAKSAGSEDTTGRTTQESYSLAAHHHKFNETAYTKFVIVGEGRSGSTFLQLLLASHPNILSYGELLNPNTDQRENDARNYGQFPALTRADDAIEFLNRYIFIAHPETIQACGFRLFYSHGRAGNWRDIWEALREAKIKTIHLKRQNYLDRYLSLQLGFRSQQWTMFAGDARQKEEPIVLDPIECLKDFQRASQQRIEADQFFQHNPKIDVIYEKLSANPEMVMREVQSFLNIDQHTLLTNLVKQRVQKKSEIIANYEELKAQFESWASEGLVPFAWLDFFDET